MSIGILARCLHGLVDRDNRYMTLVRKMKRWPDALSLQRTMTSSVCGYGDRGDEAPNTGEIFALYVFGEYYGKIGRKN